jgi:hypothetical protein
MQWKSPVALALLARDVYALNMLRFACSQLVERLDPIWTPGELTSPHLYQVAGGNYFNASMDPFVHDTSAQ